MEELARRPARPPDFDAENRALVVLVQALADSPRTILQRMSEVMLETFGVGSSGFSLLNKDDGGASFYWPAIAGVWKCHIGGGTPRDFGPCGDVLDRNAPLLFKRPERRYPYFLPVTPHVEECLLVPFYVAGKAVGTIWLISHDQHREFDAEDLRQLNSLGRFASSAYQALESIDYTVAINQELVLSSVRQHELTEMAENLNAQLQGEIAERKQAEEALKLAQGQLTSRALQLEALVSERTARLQETVGDLEAFSYSIAHDMRAPLRAMTSFIRLVLAEHSDQLNETAKGYLERVGAASLRLDRLILEVLNYTTISRQKLNLEAVDLEKLVEEAICHQPEFQSPRAEIHIQGPLRVVIAHEPSLMQCVNNILGNAVKFVLPGVVPRITVRSELIGDEVRLWFEDNGIGISPADKGRVFSLFGRLNPAAEFEGTGIGLSIVGKAVKRMGGTIDVESEPGRGSRFWIQLKKSEGV